MALCLTQAVLFMLLKFFRHIHTKLCKPTEKKIGGSISSKSVCYCKGVLYAFLGDGLKRKTFYIHFYS